MMTNAKNLKLMMVIVLGILLSACSSNPTTAKVNKSLPDWVLNPLIENGLASTSCVPSTGYMNIDKQKAIVEGRADIAQQLSVNVRAMDKTYNSRTDTASGSAIGGSFESVSKQLAQQHLQGSRAIKVQYVDIADVNNLCVLVALSPNITQDLYQAIVKNSGRLLSTKDDDVLYQEFKAYKAQQELAREMSEQ